MQEIRAKAKERMKGFCRVCPICDGKSCVGEVPGMGGLGTAASFKANVEALRQVRLAMRCLHSVKEPDLSTNLLGLRLSMPVLAAPIGGIAFNMGCTEDGVVTEQSYAKAIIDGCRQAGILGCGGDGVGDVVHQSAFDAIAQAGGWGIPFIKPWDSAELDQKITKALALGCRIIGMDVDAAGLITLRKQGRPVSAKTPQELRSLTARLHEAGVAFMIKGVMTVEDALLAVDAGVDALVVSNHGGRVLDHTPGTAEVLPAIAQAVAKRCTVLVDGGVRDGSDVLKMLALGADAVLIGRPFSIAACGKLQEGVFTYAEQLRSQLTQAMTLTGCPNIGAAGAHLIA